MFGLWEKTVLGENRKKMRKNVEEARGEKRKGHRGFIVQL